MSNDKKGRSENMSDKDFVDQLRKKNADEDAPKKRWGSYSTTEVEAYIEKLNEKIAQTEKVFQEQNEDLKRSLKAVTRERDELLKQGELVKAEEIDENQMADLERLLMRRGILAIPKEVFESLQHADTESNKRARQLEESLEEMKAQHQSLKKSHQELQEAFSDLSHKKPADRNSENVEKHYLNIIRNQHAALGTLKSVLLEAVSQLENITQRELDDWDFPLGNKDES